jgi:autotransporter-associated beta strand protein
MKSPHCLIALIAALVLSIGTQLHAAPNTLQVSSGNWNAPNSWSLAAVPTASDDVYIGFISGSNSAAWVKAGDNLSCHSLTLGDGVVADRGSLCINSGTLTIGTGAITSGAGNDATIQFQGGPGMVAALNAASINVYSLVVGTGMATGCGAYTIPSGQSWTVTEATIGNGTATQNCSGTLTLNGGNLTTTNLTLTKSGTTSATFIFTSGTLSPQCIIRATAGTPSVGSETFLWNGGTIQNQAGYNLFIYSNAASPMGIQLAGTGIHTLFVSPGNTITEQATAAFVDQAGQQGTLTIDGGGTVIVSSTANTYSGMTWVNSGTLQISATGALGTGDVGVSAGATLTLQNSSAIDSPSNVTLDDNTACMNLNYTGILTINSLSLSGSYVASGTYTASQLDSTYGHSWFANSTGSGMLAITGSVPQPTWIRLKSGSNGQYLSESGSGTVICEFLGWSDQTAQWSIQDVGSGQTRIRNRASGHYMNVQHDLGLVECNAGASSWSSEKWTWIPQGDYSYQIQNVWKHAESINVQNTPPYVACTNVSGTSTSSWWNIEIVRGATVPWTEYEAENAITTGTVIGPDITFGTMASEASNRRAVKLDTTGQYVKFTSTGTANSIVVRLSIPDSPGGGGADATLNVYVDDTFIMPLNVTSKYSWLYGPDFPTNLTNTPGGTACHVFDEASALLTDTNGQSVTILPGHTLTLQKDSANTAASYTIDFIDLEQVPPALTNTNGYIDITAYGAKADGTTDNLSAITAAYNAAKAARTGLWITSGTFLVSNNLIVNGIKINGAGMWYSKLLSMSGSTGTGFNVGNNVQISDIAIFGKSTNRNDGGAALIGSPGSNSVLQNLWIEHFAGGIALGSAATSKFNNLTINNCRIRDLTADGINLHCGATGSLIENTTIRSSGDDGIALWSLSGTTAAIPDNNNVITNCTVQMPWISNGIAVYGGSANLVQNCEVYDIATSSGLMISAYFAALPFASATIQNVNLYRCGGTDYANNLPFGAIEVKAMDNNINNAPINVSNIDVYNASYSGIELVCGSPYTQNDVVFSGINIKEPVKYGITTGTAVPGGGTAVGSGSFEAVSIYSSGSAAVLNSSGTNYQINQGPGNNWTYP